MATPTPLPTPTINPYDYVVIGHEVKPEGLYSYVSGWIVESDGRTPRPVAVRLTYPTGELRYPRPNNADVASGRYEFLVSPGEYWLTIDDQGSPRIPIVIGQEAVRHEVSFRLTKSRPIRNPAISSPWWSHTARPTVIPDPTATAVPDIAWTHRIYLSFLTHDPFETYLPMIVKEEVD